MKAQLRAGAVARGLQFELHERSGLTPETLDRMALALGVQSLAQRPPTPEDADAGGGPHELAPLLKLGRDGLVADVLALIGTETTATEGGQDSRLRLALNRGYAELWALLGRPGATWHGVLQGLLGSLQGRSGENASQSSAQAVEVELGWALGDPNRRIPWFVNSESGHATNANTRIAGASGKGKTQVLLRALAAIAEASSDTGAFVLDYKGDISSNERFVAATGARVVEPGRGQPLPINPFELPGDLPPTIAARAFAEVFASLATGLGAVQKHLLNETMRRCFEKADREGASGPTLADIHHAVLRRYEHEGRPGDTVTALLDDVAALGLFAQRSMSVSDLLRTRWIIKLDTLGDLRTVVGFVLVEYLHNLANALPEAPFDRERRLRSLRTVVAIDEAHYYLRGRCTGLLGLIRIGRSKGTPVFLSSQSLEDYRAHTELDELFANTLVFGHGKAPSSKALAGALALSREEGRRATDRVTRLEQFEALTNIAGPASAAPIRCHAFFERTNQS